MKPYKYIIIGGGMTGLAAVKGIRENDAQGTIALFSKERFPPYNRPPLTKGLWENKEVASILNPLDEYAVDLFLETTIEKLLPESNQVSASNGEVFQYQKLLLATGGTPRHFKDDPQGVIYYRTLDDFRQLKKLTDHQERFCIIGGGFIGSELAAALTKNHKKVTLIFPESGISGSLFPQDLATFLVQYYQDKGVEVLTESRVDSIQAHNEKFTVKYHHVGESTSNDSTFDGVIAGIGIEPNTSLAEACGIDVDNGIIVNEFLQTNHPDVFAAGDVANFPHIPLGKRMRVEHADNAQAMGMAAGQNMSGEPNKYDHFPFFYSDLFDLGYEAVGEIDPSFDVFEDWIEPFKKGTVFYLQDSRIRGLIFWNLWDRVEQGQAVITSGKTFKETELSGMFR